MLVMQITKLMYIYQNRLANTNVLIFSYKTNVHGQANIGSQQENK